MRIMLFAISAIALSVFAGAVAANAQSARVTRAPAPPAPYVAREYVQRPPVFPYATSNSAYYDPHFSQYPEWAQKAFTPGRRR